MSDKIQGTLILDGLIEGRLPGGPDAQTRLDQWVKFAGSVGLAFTLEIDGGNFNLLADNAARPVSGLAPDPAEKITAALNELLKLFNVEERQHVFSTLRSTEYRPGSEIQTLYVVGPEGRIVNKQRTVDAHTAAAEPPLTRGQKLKMAAMGLLIALVVLALSSFFVDYRKFFGQVKDAVVPVHADEVTVDGSAFRDYFSVEGKKTADRGLILIVTVKRTPKLAALWARGDGKATTAPSATLPSGAMLSGTVPATEPAATANDLRLVEDAVARGYVRCEYFDTDGRFLGFEFKRIKDLRDHETAELGLPTTLQSADGRAVRIRRAVMVP